MTLLLAVFQAAALVILQHAMLAAVVAVAETAVADDALGRFLAVLVGAANLLRGHAAKKRESDVDGRRRPDIERGESGR